MTKVISSKLFLDLEPSFSEDLIRALRGCFRGASVTQYLVSFRFKVRGAKPPTRTLWDVFFDVLITLSKGVSDLGMFYCISKLYRNFNKRRISPAQATTTE